MDTKTLSEMISVKFDESIEITHFEKKENKLPLINNEEYSWRDYLLDTFTLRLRHGQKKGADPDLLNEIQSFVNELQKLHR